MKYDSLPTLILLVDVGARLAGLEHGRDISLFSAITGWERSENRLNRLLSCVGMSKIRECFLLFLATMASITQKTVASPRMAERCVCKKYTPPAMRGSRKMELSAFANETAH